ncbi:MAG: hypothetical protein HZA66_02200 [Rhodopseudomonas palustris]|uniref:Uncharacterized protein n=1 Tax=Rhodopseudomonas palustris TaxID=1076 RepID=A0A933RTC7_RHOPL|nr:hypothetical protein [Rhodopseudomonas palustris]
MAPKKPSAKTSKRGSFVIGSGRFRKISAVEGIEFSGDMKGSTAVDKSEARSPEQRRQAIIKAYSK